MRPQVAYTKMYEVDLFTVTELEGEKWPAHKTVMRGTLTFSWPFEAP